MLIACNVYESQDTQIYMRFIYILSGQFAESANSGKSLEKIGPFFLDTKRRTCRESTQMTETNTSGLNQNLSSNWIAINVNISDWHFISNGSVWNFLFLFIRIFYDGPSWRISVRLSDRSQVTQNKINFIKNYPQWGLNPWLHDHHSNTLPTELGRNLLKIWSEISLFHAPLHMLDFVYF